MNAASKSLPGPQPAPATQVPDGPHRVELEVQRRLMSLDATEFHSLVVRRIADGVCLEGVVEYSDEYPDVGSILQSIDGVTNVLNHLVPKPHKR